MSDPDAFLRQILATPGDDAPRLAFADWLDERNDPRGPYLRAECRAAQSPDARPAAEQLRATVDLDWALTVSRPPLGVCAAHLTFGDPGPTLTPADIDQAEQRLGTRLPPDYRAFLLLHNGGTVQPE